MDATLRLWSAMLGGGAGAWGGWPEWARAAALAAIALLLPNTAEIFGRVASPGWYRWRPSGGVAILMGLGLGIAVSASIAHPSAFLYFRF